MTIGADGGTEDGEGDPDFVGGDVKLLNLATRATSRPYSFRSQNIATAVSCYPAMVAASVGSRAISAALAFNIRLASNVSPTLATLHHGRAQVAHLFAIADPHRALAVGQELLVQGVVRFELGQDHVVDLKR